MIKRSENIEATQRNKQAIELNRELNKRRQEIVEHQFGTIKRQWGFDYTLMKGKQKVDGEVGLIFISYLFRRLISILGLPGFTESIYLLISIFVGFQEGLRGFIIKSKRFSGFFSFKYLFYRYSLNSY